MSGVAGDQGQAPPDQLRELELLRSAGGCQRHLIGGKKNYMPRHFETGEPGGAKIDEFLRIGPGVSGGYDAGTPDFAHLRVGKAYDEGLCN